jgi:hypothetical protein
MSLGRCLAINSTPYGNLWSKNDGNGEVGLHTNHVVIKRSSIAYTTLSTETGHQGLGRRMVMIYTTTIPT